MAALYCMQVREAPLLTYGQTINDGMEIDFIIGEEQEKFHRIVAICSELLL